MQTQTITKSEGKTLIKLGTDIDLRELSLIESGKSSCFIVDLTPKSIQVMVDKKILNDLLRFRTCCTDTIASR
jgi:hypothetical protein